MEVQEFRKLRDELFEHCRQLNSSKGEDYTKGSNDALANFKEGKELGIDSLKTCGLYMKKHMDAIFNYIKTQGQSESEPIKERIADAINYLTLLHGLIEEDNEQPRKD